MPAHYFSRIVLVLLCNCLWLLPAGCYFSEIEERADQADTLLHLSPQQKYLRNIDLIANTFEKRGKAEGAELLHTLDQLYARKGTPTDRLIYQMSLFRQGMYLSPARSDSIHHHGLAMLEEAQALNDPFLIAKMHCLLGVYYYDKSHDYPRAFQHLLTMDQMMNELGPEGYPEYAYDTYVMARSCYDFFDYENAIRYAEKLMPVESAKVSNTHIFNAALLGMCYVYQQRNAEARAIFQWAIPYLPKVFQNPKNLKLLGWTGVFMGNIGLTYFQEGEYDQAIPYLQQGLDIATTTRYWDNVPRFGAKLAKIYLHRKEFSRARQYAGYSIEAAWKMKPDIYPVARFVTEPYEVMSGYYREVGQPQLSLTYADSAQWSEAVWKKQLDVGLKHKAEFVMEIDRHAAREAFIRKEKEKQILYRNLLLSLVALGAVVAWLLYAHQLSKGKHRQQQLEADKKIAELELAHAHAQLQQIRQTVRRNSELMRLRDVSGADTVEIHSAQATQSKLMRELHQAVILTEDDWTRFVQLFEKVQPGFLARLRLSLPDLTPAEVRFLALARLDYSSREMAAILGVGPGAIRQYRLRVRRRLGVSDAVEIEQLVADI